jgi:hypothetical protein
MHFLKLNIQKNLSTGVFLKILIKKIKALKRNEKIQLLFLKFFLNYFKVKKLKKKIFLVLKKYSAKFFFKLNFLLTFLKLNIKFLLILPKLKYGYLKFKKIKAIKKNLKKKLQKQFH